jgi:hypothetical protein
MLIQEALEELQVDEEDMKELMDFLNSFSESIVVNSDAGDMKVPKQVKQNPLYLSVIGDLLEKVAQDEEL